MFFDDDRFAQQTGTIEYIIYLSEESTIIKLSSDELDYITRERWHREILTQAFYAGKTVTLFLDQLDIPNTFDRFRVDA